MASRGRDTDGVILRGGTGGRLTTAVSVSSGVPPRKRRLPGEQLIKQRPPRSRCRCGDRPRGAGPWACSGDMYAGVPTTVPLSVICDEDRSGLARPKSITRGLAVGVDHDVRRLEVAMDDALSDARLRRRAPTTTISSAALRDEYFRPCRDLPTMSSSEM